MSDETRTIRENAKAAPAVQIIVMFCTSTLVSVLDNAMATVTPTNAATIPAEMANL